MDIEKAKQDLKYIIDPFRIDGTTLKYSNAVRFILSELEKQSKLINEMSIYVNSPLRIPEEKYCEFYNSGEDCCWKTDKECKDCIIEYFTNKAENVGE